MVIIAICLLMEKKSLSLKWIIINENIELLKVKLRWSKSSQLLQQVAFLVEFVFIIQCENKIE